jgi:hypothetical protein
VNRIHQPLQDDFQVGAHVTKAPKALVRIGYGGRWSWAVQALIDTGSPVTIVSTGLARKLGWQQPEGEPPLDLGGYGGSDRQPAWRGSMSVSFVESFSQEPLLGLLLQDSAVFVSDLVGRDSVLIGQRDALERLRFLQRNQEPYWDFELSLPEADE